MKKNKPSSLYFYSSEDDWKGMADVMSMGVGCLCPSLSHQHLYRILVLNVNSKWCNTCVFFQALPVLCRKKFYTKGSSLCQKTGFAFIPRSSEKTLRFVSFFRKEANPVVSNCFQCSNICKYCVIIIPLMVVPKGTGSEWQVLNADTSLSPTILPSILLTRPVSPENALFLWKVFHHQF